IKRDDARRSSGFWVKATCSNAPSQMAEAMALDKKGHWRAAGHAYRAVVYVWPDASEAPVAQIAYARTLEKRGRDHDAFLEYQYLVDYYAGQFPHDEIMGRQLALASRLRDTKRMRWFFGGFHSPESARPLFEKLVANAPSWTNAPYAQFQIGRIHEQCDEFEEAMAAYDAVQSRYYSAALAPEAAFRRAACLAALSDSRPSDEATCETARLALLQFSRDFSATAFSGKARSEVDRMDLRLGAMAYEKANYYDNVVHRPAAAIPMYEAFLKRFPNDLRAVVVRTRLAMLRKG
ncbi:MAG: hypothetical protein WCL16_07055, partial [bacterium]